MAVITIPIYPPKVTHKYDCIWLKCHQTDSETELVDSGELAVSSPGNSVLSNMTILGTTTNIWDNPIRGITGDAAGTSAFQQGLSGFFDLREFEGFLIISAWLYLSGSGGEIIFCTGNPFGGSNPDAEGCVSLRRSGSGSMQLGLKGKGVTVEAWSQPANTTSGTHHIMYAIDMRDWANVGPVVTAYIDGQHVASGTGNQVDNDQSGDDGVDTLGDGPPNSDNFSFGQRFNNWPPTDTSQTLGKIDGINAVRSLYIAKIAKDDFNLVEYSMMANAFYRAQGGLPRSVTK